MGAIVVFYFLSIANREKKEEELEIGERKMGKIKTRESKSGRMVTFINQEGNRMANGCGEKIEAMRKNKIYIS